MGTAKATAAEAGAAVTAKRRVLEDVITRHNATQAELSRARQLLAERVGHMIDASKDREIEDEFREIYQIVSAAKQQHETAYRARENEEHTVLTLEQTYERLRVELSICSSRREQLSNKLTEIAQQIREIDEDVRKVTKSAQPQAERAALNRRRNQLASTLQATRQRMTEAGSELAAAAAHVEASKNTFRRAETDAQRARDQVREAAIGAGFSDESAAAQAEIAPPDEQRISDQVEGYRNECLTAETRINELTRELGGAEVAEEALTTAETTATRLRTDLSDAEGSAIELRTRLETLANAVDRAKELRTDLDQQRAAHSLYHSLALDLRSDRFQQFLLQQTFQELVSGASVRLWDLTKRYRFEWQNEAFYVVDHDNARQLRSAETLSGGETFLASLALALQLSEQVQKAAGATKLDSLFIDEGFGTLDLEALDAAASAIESLRVGGRMVGIISHIEELSLRLPARVRVEKTPDGSHLITQAS
jgi:exonuclease SbcC